MNPYLILGYFRAKPTSQLPSGFGASNIFQVKHYSDSSRHRQKFREECVTVPFRPQGLHAFTSRRWICYNTLTVFILEIEILVAEKWKKESAKKNSRSVNEQLAFCRSQQLQLSSTWYLCFLDMCCDVCRLMPRVVFLLVQSSQERPAFSRTSSSPKTE